MSGGAQAFYQKMLAEQQAKAAGAGGGSAAPAAPVAPPPLVVTPPKVTPPPSATLVVFGATNYTEFGKKVGAKVSEDTPNLMSPHRLVAGLGGLSISFVATSCVSSHIVAIAAPDDAVFTWGRNDAGQLGLGDSLARPGPTRVRALDGKGAIRASCGKAHTVLVTSAGGVLACGAATQGCIGTGLPKKAESATSPVAVAGLSSITHVSSGGLFNLARDEDGEVWSWGWSEYGVLGNGDDHCHNTKDASVKLTYKAVAPARVRPLAGKKVVVVACGQNHCAAATDAGVVYTWGYAGHGRLGHRDQKDLWIPTALAECRAKEISCGQVRMTG